MVEQLNPFDDLHAIGQIESANHKSTLVMQSDGNLVLYRGGKARWASGTAGRTVTQAVMQGDGNFVLYGPGGAYVWDSGTDGHPGASLIVQDDGNVVIYDPAGVALWASNTSITVRSVPGFLPSTSAFHFANAFPAVPHGTINLLGNAIPIGDASQGLCGGMAFAARDYFEAGVPIPSMTAPPTSGPVFDHIVMRLYESFNLLLPPPPPPAPPIVPIITPIPPFGPGPMTYWWLMNPALPDHETVASNINMAPRGRAWVAIVDSWPQIRSDIDGNRLSPIALIEVKSHDPLQMGKNHQVLAYGYELDGADLAIRVYDPNFPDDDDVTVSLNISDPQHTTPITHSGGTTVFCFFHQVYTPPLRPVPSSPPPLPAPVQDTPPDELSFDPSGSVVVLPRGRDVALVRQTPGWGSIPIAFGNGDGTWNVTNGAASPDFVPSWANQPGVRLVPGDFNGNGLTDIALVRQTPGWGSIPIAFANGDGTWNITNGAAGPDFIPAWANQPGVRLVPGDFNGNGLTDIALVRQTPGWGSIPIAFANGDGTWNITNGAAGPDFIPAWANQPGVRLVPGDFNGNGLTDIALVRQTPGWGSIPIAFANGDGTWNITNGAAGPDFIPAWANQPGVRLVPGDFNGNGLTDIALVRQTPGWGSIPIAFANGDGTWNITNGAAGPDFIPAWANQPGVRLVPGDFNGNGLTDIALVRQTPGWGSIPIAFANGDGTWNITNGAAGPDFIPAWANQPGVRLVPGDFNGNGLTDIALVRQTPGWGSIPIAFANGDGTWNITNGAAGPDFIPAWANQPGVRLVPGDFR